MMKDFLSMKKCFGKYKCWNQVRARCPIATSCAMKAKADQVKEEAS
jgi:hypothetical protein